MLFTSAPITQHNMSGFHQKITRDDQRQAKQNKTTKTPLEVGLANKPILKNECGLPQKEV